MNPTKICWADSTWNPIVGCSRGCSYCYAKRIATRFHDRYKQMILDGRAIEAEPRRIVSRWRFDNPLIIPERLAEPARAKKPKWVFVCSMGELFDPRVPDEWRDQIIAAMYAAPQHTYIILTKREDRLDRLITGPYPDRTIIGITLDSDEMNRRERTFRALDDLARSQFTTLLCVEPIRERMHRTAVTLRHAQEIEIRPPSWLIIGAETGAGARKPQAEWIVELVEAAQAAGIPTWVKDNAHAILRPVRPDLIIQQKPEV